LPWIVEFLALTQPPGRSYTAGFKAQDPPPPSGGPLVLVGALMAGVFFITRSIPKPRPKKSRKIRHGGRVFIQFVGGTTGPPKTRKKAEQVPTLADDQPPSTRFAPGDFFFLFSRCYGGGLLGRAFAIFKISFGGGLSFSKWGGGGGGGSWRANGFKRGTGGARRRGPWKRGGAVGGGARGGLYRFEGKKNTHPPTTQNRGGEPGFGPW